ncbi:hypothetical protein [Vibrio algicola]|uniref:Uncharacterized protein n=1 Tax=Vibrio algicola TaxID=2662262 RepID=A0A5Q0TIP9_9VIBR|nr:hypothetical protein [Vibrio algicola]
MSWTIESDTTTVSHNAGRGITVLELAGDVLTPSETNATARYAMQLERLTRGVISRISALNAIEHISKQLDSSMKREFYAYNTIAGLERLAQCEVDNEAIEPDPIKRLNHAIGRLRHKQKKATSTKRKRTIAESIIALQRYRDSLKEGTEKSLPINPESRREALFNVGIGRYIQSCNPLSRGAYRGSAMIESSNVIAVFNKQAKRNSEILRIKLSTDDAPPAPVKGRNLAMPMLSLEARDQTRMILGMTTTTTPT